PGVTDASCGLTRIVDYGRIIESFRVSNKSNSFMKHRQNRLIKTMSILTSLVTMDSMACQPLRWLSCRRPRGGGRELNAANQRAKQANAKSLKTINHALRAWLIIPDGH